MTALDKVTSSASRKSSVEGQALFLRGSIYFELVKLYAKPVGDGDYAVNPGVPLVLTPTGNVTDADYKARATVKAVYDQVIIDLVKAESLLPSSNTIYATKWSAAAQLSRVYLALKSYTEAGAAANRVITGSGKTLATEIGKNWFTFINNGGSTPGEYLFSMKMTAQDGTNALNTYFGRTISTISGTAGRSDCKIKAAHLTQYETGDKRKDYFILSGGNYYSMKHLDRLGDVPVVRLSEMYLTRAEANQRAFTSVGATPLSDVNAIRIGNKVNVQDGAVLHCTYQKTTLTIGNNVSIGHNALVHGCTIEDNVLVGMGAIVMDNCYVESNCIIAAGAVLLEGTRVESWSVFAGVPAKKVKQLSPELFKEEVMRIADNYVFYASWFK